jgi:hypothetical protein
MLNGKIGVLFDFFFINHPILCIKAWMLQKPKTINKQTIEFLQIKRSLMKINNEKPKINKEKIRFRVLN